MKIPLFLKYHFYPVISIVADAKVLQRLQNGEEATQELTRTVTFEQSKESPLDYQVTLHLKTVEVPGKLKTYDMELVVVGFFEVEKDYPEKDRESMVTAMGASMLYGGAREMLLMLTARGPFPPIYLPTTTFVLPPEDKGQPSTSVEPHTEEEKPKRKPRKK